MDFALNIGKDIYETPCFPDCADLPLSKRITVYLAQNLLDKQILPNIIVDNWYSSTRLSE